jgi:hypothetical protein
VCKSRTSLNRYKEDLRRRLADVERAAGLADLARTPIGRGEPRRFAGGRA